MLLLLGLSYKLDFMDDDGMYDMEVGTHVLWHTCKEQRTIQQSQFSPSKYICARKTVCLEMIQSIVSGIYYKS